MQLQLLSLPVLEPMLTVYYIFALSSLMLRICCSLLWKHLIPSIYTSLVSPTAISTSKLTQASHSLQKLCWYTESVWGTPLIWEFSKLYRTVTFCLLSFLTDRMESPKGKQALFLITCYWNLLPQTGTWTHVLELEPSQNPTWDLNPHGWDLNPAKILGTWFQDLIKFRFLMSHHRKNSGRDKMICSVQFSSVAQSCLTLCDHMDCSTPGFPVHHQLAPTAYSNLCPLSRWCHPSILSSVIPFSSCLQIAQHLGIFQWICSSHQVAKGLEFQFQLQPFQWIFRTDFL